MKTKVIVIFLGILFAAVPAFLLGVLITVAFKDWQVGLLVFVFFFGLGLDVLFNTREQQRCDRKYRNEIR